MDDWLLSSAIYFMEDFMEIYLPIYIYCKDFFEIGYVQ